jgi:hypothetical protein
MIRSAKVLFCDNEHGLGEVTFPEVNRLDEQALINPLSVRELRRRAKAEGWTRHNKADYCPSCSCDDPLNHAVD